MNSAPISAVFVKAYNAILVELQKFGYCNNLDELPVNSAVTQDNLAVLRSAVSGLMGRSKKFDVTYSYDDDNNKIDASPLITWRKINDGKGWLILPATHDIPAVYEYPDPDNDAIHNGQLDNMPVLFDHLQDIISNLNSINNIVITANYYFSYSCANGIYKHKDAPTQDYGISSFSGCGSLSAGVYSTAHAGWMDHQIDGGGYTNEIICADKTISAISIDDPGGTADNRVIMVFVKDINSESTQQGWGDDATITSSANCTASWESCSFPTTEAFSNPVESIDVPVGYIGTASKSESHYAIPHEVMMKVSIKVDDITPVENDHPENGLIKTGCSSGILGEAVAKSDTEIRYNLGTGNSVPCGAKFELYLSNIFVKDAMDGYFTNIQTAGVSYLPTSFTFKDESDNDVPVMLAVLQRPNGAYAPVAWKNDDSADSRWGEPLTGGGYRVLCSNGACSVYFNDGVIHNFDSEGNFAGAFMRTDEGTVHVPRSGVGVGSATDPTRETTTAVEGTGNIFYTYSNNILQVSRVTFTPAGQAENSRYSSKVEVSGGRSYMNYRSFSGPVEESQLTQTGGGTISGGATANPDTSGNYTASEQILSANGVYKQVSQNYVLDDSGVWKNTITSVLGGTSSTVVEDVIKLHGKTLPTQKRIDDHVAKYGYYDSGELQYQLNYDGTWSYNYLDADMRLAKKVTPFGNVVLTFDDDGTVIAPDELFCRTTEYDYASQVSSDTALPGDTRPRRVVEKVKGVEIARRYYVYVGNEYREELCVASGAVVGTASNIVTTKYSYPDGTSSGWHWKTLNPDGTMVLSEYTSSGGFVYTSTFTGSPNTAKTTVVDGRCTVEKANSAGQVVERITKDVATNLILDSQTCTYYLGRPHITTFMDGSTETAEYACCGPLKVIHRDGSVTEYRYTPDKRPAMEIGNGVATLHSYDAAGHEIARITGPAVAESGGYAVGWPRTEGLNEYYANGELSAVKVAIPLTGSNTVLTDSDYSVTSYSAGASGGFWQKTAIMPDGGTVIEAYNTDGTLANRSGTAAESAAYSKILSGSEVCSQETVYYGSNSSATVKTFTDFGGRQYKTVYTNGSETRVFDSAGRVSKVTDRFGTVSMNQYNNRGELWKTCVVMSGGSGFGLNDRITEYQNVVSASTISATVGVSVSTVLEYDDNATVGIVVKTTEQCNLDNSEKVTEYGRTTTRKRTYYNDAEEQGMSEVITYPDNSTVANSYTGGLLEQSVHSVLGGTAYQYDELNRLESVSKNDGGTAVVTAYTYDGSGNTLTETVTFNGANARTTTRTFDKMNRMLTENLPGNRLTAYTYTLKGEVASVEGYGTYKQVYTYERGQVKTLTTYQNAATPELTKYVYNKMAQPTTKTYADGKSMRYTYIDGRMTQRRWPNNVLANYTYNKAGQVVGIAYSDETPPVSYRYDRRGRLKQVTDGRGTAYLSYNSDNTLDSETIPHYNGRVMKYVYDALGRMVSQGVYNNAAQSYDMQTTYSYDAMSRLAAIAGLGKSAAYTRFAESNRLNTVNFGASYPQVNYSYDAQLRMTSKGLWTRTFNPKDEVTQIAPAAGSGVGNLSWYHSYDAAGQLSQGIFGLMGPSGPAGTTYNYSYDQIGNHQLSGVTYNTVNQPSNLTYDANGNMTAKDGKQYVYDGENRLVRILENFYDAWEQGVEFHYDYAGRCYQRNDVFIDYTDSANNYNTPYEYIIYDGTKQIMTLDGDKNVTGKYVWQPESSGDADVILWDQGGVYSTDCNKNVVAYNIIPEWPDQPSATYYDYTPFGVPIGNAGAAQRFMFSSEEWFPARSTLNYDLRLYLYRAYSPALARFLTRDPIEEQGGVNLYNFVHNNPVTRWDKNGTCGQSMQSSWLGNIYETTCNEIGSAYVCVEENVVKVVENVFVDTAYGVGSVTGPTGDIISGFYKSLAGFHIKTGTSEILNGLYRLSLYAITDVYAFIRGNTYGKYQGYERTINLKSGSWTDWVLPLVIPNYGRYAGANVGYDQYPLYSPLCGVDSTLENASYNHDKNMDYDNNKSSCPPAGEAHLLWIKNVHIGEGVEPGAIGQGYRLLGTIAFLVGAVVDRRNR